MKARILDIEELSDSIEVYESKPNKICSLFVYFILVVLVIGIVWSYCSKVEVTIKSLGVIKNREEKTIFTSEESGVIDKCFVKNGDLINIGDKLYSFATKDLDNQIEDYTSQLEDYNAKKSIINMYIMYLEGKINEWDVYETNEYFKDYNAKKILLDSKCNGLDEASINTIKQTEIALMYEEKRIYEQKYSEIKSLIQGLELEKERSIIYSNQKGIVSLKEYIVGGYTLQEGQEVLSIVPENEEGYIVESYMLDTDIGKIKKGMSVKFALNAYPSKDYGYITGIIENIADEAVKSEMDGMSYYLIKIKVNEYNLKNDNNNVAEIKDGMNGTVQVISSKERLLKLLLEKMKLL